MPELGGFALCREVEAFDPLLPVIVITGHSGMSFALRAMQSGAADYLVKPVDADAVLVSVRRALETRAMKVELRQHAGSGAPDAKRRKACASVVAGREEA
jgi:DNA-binding NtrC family response regulator